MDGLSEFFRDFFSTDSFPPRWYCGKWSEFHGWLYIISDLLIWAAYFTIPFLLIHFIRRKKDVPFPKVFWLFGAFILACGTTHLIDAIIFWVPIYRVSAVVRFLTAVASWSTIFVLYKILPDAFSLKTPGELERQVQERTEQLNLSVSKMKFLANAMSQIVWTAKPDGFRDYFNEPTYKYTGLTHEELAGFGWTQMLHPDDLNESLSRWERSINDGSDYEMEVRYRNNEGIFKWFLARAIAQKDENDNILMWVGTATEIEHQKSTAEALERMVNERTDQLMHVNAELVQSNMDLERFAAVASHDLQAPLRTISNYIEMIGERNADVLDERSMNYFGRILEASKRMKRLIESLLQYSQINATKAEMAETDLNQVLESVVANIDDLIASRNVTLQIAQMPKLIADETQISQLFQNLISNGVIYNDSENPVIQVGYTEEQHEHVFNVSDNGRGIEDAFIEKIFDVFTRLQADKQGTGLGLSIAKRIVDKHEGRIWLSSDPGKGTTFYFTIPKRLKGNF